MDFDFSTSGELEKLPSISNSWPCDVDMESQVATRRADIDTREAESKNHNHSVTIYVLCMGHVAAKFSHQGTLLRVMLSLYENLVTTDRLS